MFMTMLRVQWKWTRVAALIASLLGFGLPVVSMQTIQSLGDRTAVSLVGAMQDFGLAYAMFAMIVGLGFAMIAWAPDMAGRFVYALSLPVSRARYTAMRFAAGALFLSLPALAVLVGGIVAIEFASLPAGIHGYPATLALHVLLACVAGYSLFFALASASARDGWMLLGVVVAVALVSVALWALKIPYDLPGQLARFIFGESGPLSVFAGRWMLVDA